MPTLFAHCRNCNRWFPSIVGLAENAKNVTVTNLKMQCGKCGGDAPVIDGVYNSVGETIEIVKSHDLTAKELKALTQILQRAISLNTPAGQIRDLIAKEVPRAVGLNKFIDDKRGLVVILTLLVAVLALIMPYIKSPGNNDDLNAEKIIKAIIESKTPKEPVLETKGKVGVNALCWCGSGKKNKKCHSSRISPNAPSNLNQKPK